MDIPQLITTIAAFGFSIWTIIAASRRLRDLHRDWLAARDQPSGNPDRDIEEQVSHDRYRGQIRRLVAYVGILLVFLVPFTIEAGSTSRWVRTVLVVVVLAAFFSEETFLDRAREKWLEMLRRRRE